MTASVFYNVKGSSLYYEKYSNKLSMKALVEKDILMKNKKKR